MSPFHKALYNKVLKDMDNWSDDERYDYAVDMREKELKAMSFKSLSELEEKIDMGAKL